MKIEVTPSFSTVSIHSQGESEHLQNHHGLQAAYGIFSKMDFRLRYERISVDTNGHDSAGVNVFGFGPKFGLVKNWVAFYVSVGLAFGEDIEISDTWQVHPTLLFTLPISKNIEINPSAKVLIPFKSGQDTLVAFNVGTAFSTNLEKWAIRPEIGFLFNPGESGHFMHFSIGLTLAIKSKTYFRFAWRDHCSFFPKSRLAPFIRVVRLGNNSLNVPQDQ